MNDNEQVPEQVHEQGPEQVPQHSKVKKPRKKKGTTSDISDIPEIIVKEVEAQPPPLVKKRKQKPSIIAHVTPEGIQGSLLTEQRPLIVHLPIHSSDINNELFETAPIESQNTPAPPPENLVPFDDSKPDFSMFMFADATPPLTLAPVPVSVPETEPVSIPETEPVSIPESTHSDRTALPLHYSENLMIRFQDANRDQALPKSSNAVCFWDCHPFTCKPCVIPTIINEGIWYVYGNFCSPECAAAHLFHENLNIHTQWERYALLNRLYSQPHKTVPLAPSRSVLRMFGGTLEISDYRAIVSNHQIRIDVMEPPIISIIKTFDTKPLEFYDSALKHTFIPWEMDRMNRPGAQGLRLRRTKPRSDYESTLIQSLGLTGLIKTIPASGAGAKSGAVSVSG